MLFRTIIVFIIIYILYSRIKKKRKQRIVKYEKSSFKNNGYYKNDYKKTNSKFSNEVDKLKADLKTEYGYYKDDIEAKYKGDRKNSVFNFFEDLSDDIKKEIEYRDASERYKKHKKKKARKKVKEIEHPDTKRLIDDINQETENRLSYAKKEIKNESFEEEFLKAEDFKKEQLVKSIIIKEILDKPLSLRDE